MANFDQLKAKIEADPSFGEKLFELESAEEAQSFLKAEGMEFSIDELNAFAEAVNKYVESGGELSEDDLENVAGGVSANYHDTGITRSDLDSLFNSFPGLDRRNPGKELRNLFRRW